jgi:transcriptional regulator with XRE-family HTH domain
MHQVPESRAPEIWWTEFYLALKRDFTRRKEFNPRYSVRSFASSLEISNGAMSELLNGKRSLSLATCRKLAPLLKMTTVEKRRLMAALKQPVSKTMVVPPRVHAEFLKDWISHAVLGLYELETAETIDDAWIAKKLSLPLGEIARRSASLLAAGLLVKNEIGRVSRRTESWDLRGLFTVEDKIEMMENSATLSKKAMRSERASSLMQVRVIPANEEVLIFAQQELERLFDTVDAMAESLPSRNELIRLTFQAFKYDL